MRVLVICSTNINLFSEEIEIYKFKQNYFENFVVSVKDLNIQNTFIITSKWLEQTNAAEKQDS